MYGLKGSLLLAINAMLIQCKKLMKNMCLPPGQVSLKATCPDEMLSACLINNCYMSLKMAALKSELAIYWFIILVFSSSF